MRLETIHWESPAYAQPPELREQEIHIWRAWLSLNTQTFSELRLHLSSDEQHRVARLRFERDRNRFIAARGVLRLLLGQYLQKSPRELRFHYGPRGKPSLDLETMPQPLRFNLSHSGKLALFAISWNRSLGVDVEQIRPDFGGEEIARRYFSPFEIQALMSLPVEERPAGFFNFWTCKEAYIKASGDGLQVPLDSFDVRPAPGTTGAFLRGVDSRWRIWAFSPAPSFAAALVSDGGLSDLRFFHWNT